MHTARKIAITQVPVILEDPQHKSPLPNSDQKFTDSGIADEGGHACIHYAVLSQSLARQESRGISTFPLLAAAKPSCISIRTGLRVPRVTCDTCAQQASRILTGVHSIHDSADALPSIEYYSEVLHRKANLRSQ